MIKGLGFVGVIFVVLAIIFLGIAARDYLKADRQITIACKVRLWLAFIFAAVGIGLSFLERFLSR
jgi:hypothetical protein